MSPRCAVLVLLALCVLLVDVALVSGARPRRIASALQPAGKRAAAAAAEPASPTQPRLASSVRFMDSSLEGEAGVSAAVASTVTALSQFKCVQQVRVRRGDQDGTIGLELEIDASVSMFRQKVFAAPPTLADHTILVGDRNNWLHDAGTRWGLAETAAQSMGYPLIKITGDIQDPAANHNQLRTLEIITAPVLVGNPAAPNAAPMRDLQHALSLLLVSIDRIVTPTRAQALADMNAIPARFWPGLHGQLIATVPAPSDSDIRNNYCQKGAHAYKFNFGQGVFAYQPLSLVADHYNAALAASAGGNWLPLAGGAGHPSSLYRLVPQNLALNGHTFAPYINCDGGAAKVTVSDVASSHLQVNYALPLYIIGERQQEVSAAGGNRVWIGAEMANDVPGWFDFPNMMVVRNPRARFALAQALAHALTRTFTVTANVNGANQQVRKNFISHFQVGMAAVVNPGAGIAAMPGADIVRLQEDIQGLIAVFLHDAMSDTLEAAVAAAQQGAALANGGQKNLRDQLFKVCTGDLARVVVNSFAPVGGAYDYRPLISTTLWRLFQGPHPAGSIGHIIPHTDFNPLFAAVKPEWDNHFGQNGVAGFRAALQTIVYRQAALELQPLVALAGVYIGETAARFGAPRAAGPAPVGGAWTCAASNVHHIRPMVPAGAAARIAVVVENRRGTNSGWNEQFRPVAAGAFPLPHHATITAGLTKYQHVLLN